MLQKLWNWYKGLPWWGKVLGAGILVVGAVLLFLPSFFGSTLLLDRKKSDDEHDAVVDTALDGYFDQRRVLDSLIKNKKKELTTRLNQAAAIDGDTLAARERILKAGSMDELLRLQKELGL